MNFKKNFKRFFTLSRSAEGFTLVELIVVIAILGILTSVAVPAYSTYIKSAGESVDKQSLAVMNNALAVACAYAGVDPATGTAGLTMEWDTDGKTFLGLSGASGASVQTYALAQGEDTTLEDKDDIVTNFNTSLGLPNKPIVFKSEAYNSSTVTLQNGVFVGPDGAGSGSGTTVDGGKYVGAFDSVKENITTSVNNFKGSNFNTAGADVLMGKVDDVTGIASELFASGGELAAGLGQSVLANPAGLYNYFGLTGENATLENLQKKLADMGDAKNDLMANYAVLLTAKNTTSTQASTWLSELETNAADANKNLFDATDIKAMMSGTDATTTQNGMSKAAMVYAMYTAYTQTLTGDAKTQAEANAKDISSFVSNVNNDAGFRNYLQSDAAETDMNGYLGALDIINQSTANNTDATNDLLANGFGDDNLAFALEGLLGTSN